MIESMQKLYGWRATNCDRRSIPLKLKNESLNVKVKQLLPGMGELS
jgi:hypothetical protein